MAGQGDLRSLHFHHLTPAAGVQKACACTVAKHEHSGTFLRCFMFFGVVSQASGDSGQCILSAHQVSAVQTGVADVITVQRAAWCKTPYSRT